MRTMVSGLWKIFFLEFKPWLRQNHLGGRAWSGILLPERLPVVIKCWDSYRHNADLQKTEADIYLKLQGIWGICVPKFIAFGRVGFCHAIILERVEVIFQYSFVDGRLSLFQNITFVGWWKIKSRKRKVNFIGGKCCMEM